MHIIGGLRCGHIGGLRCGHYWWTLLEVFADGRRLDVDLDCMDLEKLCR